MVNWKVIIVIFICVGSLIWFAFLLGQYGSYSEGVEKYERAHPEDRSDSRHF